MLLLVAVDGEMLLLLLLLLLTKSAERSFCTDHCQLLEVKLVGKRADRNDVRYRSRETIS